MADTPSDLADALQRVLAATGDLMAALDPLDVAAVERGLAKRDEALEGLQVRVAAVRQALPDDLKELARATAEADRAVRERAAQVLGGLRENLRGLAAGRNGLGGYRPSVPNLPRFADRRG